MFPRTIRPGLATEVYVNILEATGPVTVTANLQDSENITVASGTKDISVGTPSTVQLKVNTRSTYTSLEADQVLKDHLYHHCNKKRVSKKKQTDEANKNLNLKFHENSLN